MKTGFACSRCVSLLLLLLTAFLGGCIDKESIDCPVTGIGRIEGFVLASGRPVDNVWVRVMPEEGYEAGGYEVRSDSTGWYSLEVPTGRYALKVGLGINLYYRRGGVCHSLAEADQVTVGLRDARADLIAGSMVLDVALPAGVSPHACDCDAVWWDDEGPDWYANGRRSADEDGLTIEFPFLPPGTYLLRCHSSEGDEFWLPPTRDVGQAARVVVGVQTPVVRSTALPQPASLTVHIQGAWQTLDLRQPRLDIVAADSSVVAIPYVDREGTARYQTFLPISARLCIRAGGVPNWVGGWSFAEATAFDLMPGDAPREVDYRESAILCTLEGPGTVPVGGARYYLHTVDGRFLAGCLPERERPAPLPNLSPGTYLLQVRPERSGQVWCDQWYDQADSPVTATPIEVSAEGIVVPVTMHLYAGGKIGGRVLEADGTAFRGTVYAYRDRFPQSGEDLHPDYGFTCDPATGAFELIGLTDGDYFLGAIIGWGQFCWYPGTDDPGSALAVRIANRGEVRGVNWRLP